MILEVPQYSCQVCKLETFKRLEVLTWVVSRSLPILVAFPISHPLEYAARFKHGGPGQMTGVPVTYRLKKWSGLRSLKSCLALPLCSLLRWILNLSKESFFQSECLWPPLPLPLATSQPLPPPLSIPFSFYSQTCSLSSTGTKTFPHFCLGFMDSLLVLVLHFSE